ncbi:hypothetical protein psyc5s11_18750 [Clostridium gelidum]|uniref:ATP F0F1 synthase synthase n=1 Tax=Clostridium gelidum TaxID=704125 RepID=A0ABM7T1M7_9CLOT|nr:hypothetical protein [Clostridium gelidum]BCZ45808.1 hypothetical protein psyc5s11_18750 [Clostridium gelidum]
MNHLVAKTKGRKGEFFKVISDEEIFELTDYLDNPIKYDVDYKLDEDEWFAIEIFSEKEYCIDFLKKTFISTDYNQIPVKDYSKIEYLCSFQTGIYYFQKLSSSQLLRKKYFSLSGAPTRIECDPIIVINSFADAIYIKESDTLYFKKLPSIISIFKGIDTLYKEATKEETEGFLQNDFIQLETEFNADKVKISNRKRIAMAMDTLEKFSQEEKKSIFSYVGEYCEDLECNEHNTKFIITNENDLKKLLFGIEQRYYTTGVGGERRLANSVIKL